MLTKKTIEIYLRPLRRTVNKLIIMNILKQIGIISRKHGNEPNFLFLLKAIASSALTILFDNGDTIINLFDIANTCNNYFASIAETVKRT